MRKIAAGTLAVVCAWLLGGHMLWARSYDNKAHAELAKALKGAHVSLEKGLLAGEREGRPISEKFEVEDGKFQLSVYTLKGDKFWEVIVDPKTGKVARVEAITGDEELMAARRQEEAMAKATRSLPVVLAEATKANRGYRPVSITPKLENGHPVADITLVKGRALKTVSEWLD